MAKKVVVFDKFNGGEYGNRGGDHAPGDSFHADNMLMYRTGQLGVRCGMVDRTPAGVAAGVVLGFGCTPVPTKDAWYVQANAFRTFSILSGNNLLTAAASMAGTATTVFDSANIGTDVYITAKGKTNSYKATINTGAGVAATLAALTGSPSGRTIASYGDRLVIGDITGSLENRLRYNGVTSGISDYNVWTSTLFIDVGDGWFISGLAPQRQHLVITKQTGFYILTGGIGTTPVLRKVSNSFGPLGALELALGDGDKLYNWPIFGHLPATFNGSRQDRVLHLDNHISTSGAGDTFPPTNGVAPIFEQTDGAAFLEKTTNKMITLINGVWSYHTFGQNISGFTSKFNGGLVCICDGGSAGAAPKFYVWDPKVDRPGIEGSTHDRAGDASATPVTGTVTFPEYWENDGDEFYVRQVIVEFTKWNTGGNANNHYDLSVDTMGTYQAGTVASNTVSFDESPASSSSTGTQARRVYGFGEQGMGNGFRLNFTNIKGIAFDKIEVILDVRPARV